MENKKKGNFKVFLKKTLKRGAIIIGYVIALKCSWANSLICSR